MTSRGGRVLAAVRWGSFLGTLAVLAIAFPRFSLIGLSALLQLFR